MQCRIFASGFRATFFAAGVAAAALIPLWVAVWAFGVSLEIRWPPTMWHAHEMLFGFVAAAIAGFLLTAVPSWTGRRGFAGAPLIALLTLWLCARLLIATSAWWPTPLVATVDLSFLPALAILIAPALLRNRNRNTPLLLVLLTLTLCNGLFHWALSKQDPVTATRVLTVAIDIVLILVTVIGGRILPAFTSSGLRQGNGTFVRLHSWRGVDAAAIAAMVGIAILDVVSPEGAGAGVLALAGALIQLVRLLQWRTTQTLRHPIIWVLHLAYAWLPLGLALKGAALLWGFAFSAFWLHALTVGTLATMILGVMSRAALGHTGRPLIVAPLTATAYGLLLLAGLVRVFAVAFSTIDYAKLILLSALLWTAAFALYLYVYAPVLWSPRIDGKPG